MMAARFSKMALLVAGLLCCLGTSPSLAQVEANEAVSPSQPLAEQPNVATLPQTRVNPFANPRFEYQRKSNQSPEAAPVEFQLKAVLVSAEGPLADINGKLLRIGDDFFGYTVAQITTTAVTLSKNGKPVQLNLRPNPLAQAMAQADSNQEQDSLGLGGES